MWTSFKFFLTGLGMRTWLCFQWGSRKMLQHPQKLQDRESHVQGHITDIWHLPSHLRRAKLQCKKKLTATAFRHEAGIRLLQNRYIWLIPQYSFFHYSAVSCSSLNNHRATSCSGCPEGHGRKWCNGECGYLSYLHSNNNYDDNNCVKKEGKGEIKYLRGLPYPLLEKLKNCFPHVLKTRGVQVAGLLWS